MFETRCSLVLIGGELFLTSACLFKGTLFDLRQLLAAGGCLNMMKNVFYFISFLKKTCLKSKQVLSTLVLIYIGRPPPGHTI